MSKLIHFVLGPCLLIGLLACQQDPRTGSSLGDRCVASCQEMVAAACTDPAPPEDCAATCSALIDSVEASGCQGQYGAALDCAEAHMACDNVDACIPQNDAYTYCIECSGSDAGCGF